MTMSRGDKLYCSQFQIICFRLIKVVKDRIRTVHQEDRLQNLIVSVAALRKRCVGHKASNSNSREWQAAVQGVMKLGKTIHMRW